MNARRSAPVEIPCVREGDVYNRNLCQWDPAPAPRPARPARPFGLQRIAKALVRAERARLEAIEAEAALATLRAEVSDRVGFGRPYAEVMGLARALANANLPGAGGYERDR